MQAGDVAGIVIRTDDLEGMFAALVLHDRGRAYVVLDHRLMGIRRDEVMRHAMTWVREGRAGAIEWTERLTDNETRTPCTGCFFPVG